MAENLVKFYQGTAAQFATATKDQNALYFVTDERRIYKGDTPFSGGIYKTVSTYPEDENAVVNTLYVNTTDGSVKYWNGTAYQTVVLPTTNAIDTDSPSTAKLVSEKGIYDYIASKISDLDVGQLATTVAEHTTKLATINGDENTAGSIAKALKDAKDYTDELANGAVATNTSDITGLKTTVGDTTLTTTAQTVTAAINELDTAVDNADITITTLSAGQEGVTEGASKTYKVYKGGNNAENLIATIDIPKDMVVSSGVVETYETEDDLPTGEGAPTATGTYIVLTLANATNDKVYIPAADLVDVYTAAADATQVQLAVNGHTLSATLVAGGVGTTELADGAVTADKLGAKAVTTAKIDDKAVGLAQLADEVTTKLTAASSAVQSITEGATNGTIDVDGTEVSVHGLGSAAYTESSAYATAEQGALADSALQAGDIVTGETNGTIKVDGTAVAVYGLGSAAYTETTAYDASGAAATAEANAKAYTDGLLAWNAL